MRLTINEQAIIKCICNAEVPATRHHIVVQTCLDFSTVDKCLANLIVTNRLVMQADGGFGLTALAKCNPVVKLMLQEGVEERLWMGDAGQFFHRTRTNHFFYGNYNIYTWAKKIRKLAIDIRNRRS